VTSKLVREIEDIARDISRSVHAVGQHVHEIANTRRQSPGTEEGVGNSVHEIGEHARVMTDRMHELSHSVKDGR
jgi:methyl-accepting chemotaxis protein